jgi:hypothetical protein
MINLDQYKNIYIEPTIIYSDGTKIWLFNNLLHNINGPAVIHPNGNKEYWLSGDQYNEFEWNKKKNWFIEAYQ